LANKVCSADIYWTIRCGSVRPEFRNSAPLTTAIHDKLFWHWQL